MLQIPEETFENAMATPSGLAMDEGVEEVVEAALSLLRRQREKEVRGPLRGQAIVTEVHAEEAATATHPSECPTSRPPRGPSHAPSGPHLCWLSTSGEGRDRPD